MSDFDKTHREGVDVRTAFASQLRRSSSERATAIIAPVGAYSPDPIAPGTPPRSIPWRMARAAYHAVKPLLRPFVKRARAYFIAPLIDHIEADRMQTEALGRELRQSTQALGRQLRESSEAMSRQMHESSEEIGRGLRELEAMSRQMHESSEEIGRGLRELDEIRQNIASLALTSAALARDSAAIASLAGISARRVAVPVGPGHIVVRTEVGYVLCSTEDQQVLVGLLEHGDLEKGTRLVIERLLGPGDVFVDVGAHIGMHTLAGARRLHGSGRVIAVEPFGPTANLLARAVTLNGVSDTVTIHVAAAGNHDGAANLFLGSISGHHSLYPLDSDTASGVAPVEVTVARLDTLLAGETRVDLIKIDTEGAELEVLEGARAVIESNPEIGLIVEYGQAHLERTGHTIAAWFAAFEAFGLEFQVIDEQTGELSRQRVEDLPSKRTINLLFARPGTRPWTRGSGDTASE